ncbi:AfsR/SARP family transcriptional regulator [Blastococcus brunescens]|uniref:BTAD domain-containing putative transcriptional regulator n=1 Tax=Blastococcus brunescens TaxID=1564165 RepID=A0ABZ1AWM2_9ACTN|nr:BTAD domain-containing putative transcriptional regulator [Blastococcus sp. BMG 8361]WRL62962.1 BTAD domain-containing putative transcriptional regulator [Blastococcus sp. BMG 8361]
MGRRCAGIGPEVPAGSRGAAAQLAGTGPTQRLHRSVRRPPGDGYALALGRDDIDALRIGDLASRGRAQLAAGDPAGAEGQLRVAVELWRGEPYADWPDADFAETERRRLDEVHSGAVAAFLGARLALGRHADVVPELERLVVEDGLREDWWRLLVLALYRSGRQADALAAVRRARTLLAEELGAIPGPALREMEAAVLAQDPALELPVGRTPPVVVPGPGAASGACPYKGLAAYQVMDAPLFHGRRRLVASLVGRLVDSPGWWSPARAGPASPPWCGPGSYRHSPRAGSPAVRRGGR